MTDRRGEQFEPQDNGFYSFGTVQSRPMEGPEDMPQPSLSELWHAGVVSQEARNSNAERQRVMAAYEPILKVLNRDRGIFDSFANPGEWAGGDVTRPLGG